MTWPALCTTCGSPYEKNAFSVCSNSFHCCRDCVWRNGRRISYCQTHKKDNMPMTKPCILLDVDGIFADFVTPCLKAVFEHTGRQFHHDDVSDWDIMKSLGIDEKTGEEIYKSMQVKDLCFNIPAYKGAREGVDRLRTWAEVIAVTSPFGGEHWMHERDRWMVEKMGFHKDDVMHVRSARKYRVWGDAFVEDKTSTLRTYREHHPDCTNVLFLRNYNRNDGWDGLSADGWPHLVALLEDQLRR